MNSKGKKIALVAIIGLTLIIVFRLLPSEDRKVENRVREAARAMEEEAIFDLAGCLSTDYADESGMTKQAILGYAKGLFDRYEGLDVDFLRLSVDRNGEKANVTAKIHVEGTDKKGREFGGFWEGEDFVDITIGLKKISNQWLIYKVNRQPGV
jgi:ketosteroid isomerase-like protein